LINNRQGGRRRGRGGQRGQNIGGQPGNRQDNRQRGNAAQLLEKYKSLARDAQLAGDRVQTEYYLQYADHYFRVLGESRSRFEEQRPDRGNDADEDEGDEEMAEAADEQASGNDDRNDRNDRAERPNRRERQPRPRFEREERSARNSGDGDGADRMNGAEESIPLDVLPPAIGADSPVTVEVPDEAEAPRPRRRPRAARPDDTEDDVAPAA
jgi:Domain of unknown function (DUF4167)